RPTSPPSVPSSSRGMIGAISPKRERGSLRPSLALRAKAGGETGMSTTKKIRLGFLGAGWWATANHMPLLAQRDDIELTAVCRLGKSELDQVKERFGFHFATESAEELVRYPGLDAVVVTSPHTLHFEHDRLGLQQGLHV